MRRLPLALAFGAACTASTAGVAIASEPGPGSIEFAAHEHDVGYRAYVAKDFDEAANHFENAFFAAPNAAELRSAIRARRDAGEVARAATLAVFGKRRFPGDAPLAKLADETILAGRVEIFEVDVTSPEECEVTVDGKVVVAERARQLAFFVDPGKHELSVGWSDDRALHVVVDATAGGERSLALEPPPRAAPAPQAASASAAEPPPSRPFGPAVFWIGVGLTAASAGLTIASGIDTENDPGQAAVKADCVGQGTSCPPYQKGLGAQLRTNVLLASTGGLALATAVVGVFFTSWARAPGPPATGLSLTPLLGPGGAGVAGTF